MAIDFRKIASKEVSIPAIMVNRTQIKTEELIGKTVTIIGVDFVHMVDKGAENTFPVLLLEEYPDRYYNGGFLLEKMCEAWANEFDGDVEAASDSLADFGGVKVELTASKTRSGNNITTINVL